MDHTKQQIIQQTLKWINDFIISLSICPFAKREIERNSVRIEVADSQSREQALILLMNEVNILNDTAAIETSLLVFPEQFRDFFDYLDFVDLAEALLIQSGYEGIYQLASFHPHYCFADCDFEDVSNYTNRSPYPMLHLLREESLDKAISYFGDTSKIPQQNIKKMHELGLEKIAAILGLLE